MNEQQDPLAQMIQETEQNNNQDNTDDVQTNQPENNQPENLSTGDNKIQSPNVAKNDIMQAEKPVIRKQPTYNKKGEVRYTPEQVLSVLSVYDDFQVLTHYDKTKFQMEFERLVNDDRVEDLEATKKLLDSTGHKWK